MQQAQYDKLEKAAADKAYMSIAINSDGNPVSGSFIPWERTVSAFNMRYPEVTISVSDLQDAHIIELLKASRLTGCYIFTALTNYHFLSEFVALEDVFILHAEQLPDLTFIYQLPCLSMFYIEDANLPDLKPLIDVCNASESLPGKCLGFYHCQVADTSSLSDVHFALTEFLVWPAPGDQRARWTLPFQSSAYRFYDRRD